jgi:hypothetical protein
MNLKKILIFISAFSISFLFIYSYYYYSQASKLERSIVAEVDTLKTLNYVYDVNSKFNTEKDNFYSSSLNELLDRYNFYDANEEIGKTPTQRKLMYAGPYNRTVLDSLIEDLLVKFPKHPPLSVKTAKAGDLLCYAYNFLNISLPKTFKRITISDRNSAYKGIQIDTNLIDSQIIMVRFDSSSKVGLLLKIDSETELLITNYDINRAKDVKTLLSKMDVDSSLEGARIPAIDFYLFNALKEEKEMLSRVPKNYTAELHHKFKISTQENNALEKVDLPLLNNFIFLNRADSLPFLIYNCNRYSLVPKK